MSVSKAFKQGFTDAMMKMAVEAKQISNDPYLQYNPEELDTALDADSRNLTQDQANTQRSFWRNIALDRALEGGAPLALPWPIANDENPTYLTTGQYLGNILNGNVHTPWQGYRSEEDSAGARLAGDLFGAAENPFGYEVKTKYPFDNNVSNFVNRAVFDQLKTPATPAQTNNLYRALQTGIGK